MLETGPALRTRQALYTLWLTLEKDGATTRMGVTSQHPLFVAGEGWIVAGELVPGDVVRDSALQALRVLSVELDSPPTRVHNLEVAGAHTYFAGELEAWGHNVNKMTPNLKAGGPHSTFKTDSCGNIVGYETWVPNPKNPSGWDSVLRFRATGKSHGGKKPPVIIGKKNRACTP